MVSDTSLQTYFEIRNSGLINKLEDQVLKVLAYHGPMTVGEMWDGYFKNVRQRSSISPRLSELGDRGAVDVLEKRRCRLTGKPAKVWRLTGNKPSPRIKKPNKDQQIKALRQKILGLESEIKNLTARIHNGQ